MYRTDWKEAKGRETSVHQRKACSCALPLSGLSGQPSPCVERKRGMEHQGRENGLQVWEGMKGFHGNFCLPVAKVALQFPRHHSCGP